MLALNVAMVFNWILFLSMYIGFIEGGVGGLSSVTNLWVVKRLERK